MPRIKVHALLFEQRQGIQEFPVQRSFLVKTSFATFSRSVVGTNTVYLLLPAQVKRQISLLSNSSRLYPTDCSISVGAE